MLYKKIQDIIEMIEQKTSADATTVKKSTKTIFT